MAGHVLRYRITGEDPERAVWTDREDWADEIAGFMAQHTGAPVKLDDTENGSSVQVDMSVEDED